jgi:Protein of unknown function (DUF2924)
MRSRPKSDPVAARLAALSELHRVSLLNLWKEVFGREAPPNLRRDLMTSILAYRIQEKAFGSLSPDSVRKLRQLARTFEADPAATISVRPTIKPGTRLVRQWQNQTHVVEIAASGYEYRGARYESLSEIARLITGTRWSGPLFFGLKTKQTKKILESK